MTRHLNKIQNSKLMERREVSGEESCEIQKNNYLFALLEELNRGYHKIFQKKEISTTEKI